MSAESVVIRWRRRSSPATARWPESNPAYRNSPCRRTLDRHGAPSVAGVWVAERLWSDREDTARCVLSFEGLFQQSVEQAFLPVTVMVVFRGFRPYWRPCIVVTVASPEPEVCENSIQLSELLTCQVPEHLIVRLYLSKVDRVGLRIGRRCIGREDKRASCFGWRHARRGRVVFAGWNPMEAVRVRHLEILPWWPERAPPASLPVPEAAGQNDPFQQTCSASQSPDEGTNCVRVLYPTVGVRRHGTPSEKPRKTYPSCDT